jgi:hypothetical protein
VGDGGHPMIRRFPFQVEARKGMGILRFLLSLLHLLIAVLGFFRHNMTELVPGYRPFQEVFATDIWSTIALVIGLGLFLLPRGSLLLIFWQFLSATYFMAFCILVSGPYGVIWGTLGWGFPSAQSFIVMYFSAQDWAESHNWFHVTKDKVQMRLEKGRSA